MFIFEITMVNGKIFTEEFRYPEDAKEAAIGYWKRRGAGDDKVASVKVINNDGMIVELEYAKK